MTLVFIRRASLTLHETQSIYDSMNIPKIEFIAYILGQKRNAAYKTCIVYGGLSHISRKQYVIVWALILGL